MTFREANTTDIKGMQIVRNLVKENVLSNPALITDELCLEYIAKRGKGWVCEKRDELTGFSIVDLEENNIWALFVHPNHEKQGIGRQLHDIMLDWYFMQTTDKVWLGTDPGTRAEIFYRKSGWEEIGTHRNGEVKFEMTFERWKNERRGPKS